MSEDTLERLLAGESPLSGVPVGDLDARPRRDVVIVTCMDARILPLRVLGLEPGDAHVIRTAGVRIGEETIRDLSISHEGMGTRHAILMAHTDCRAMDSDVERAVATVREGARRIAEELPRLVTHPVLYDHRTGELRLVDGASPG